VCFFRVFLTHAHSRTTHTHTHTHTHTATQKDRVEYEASEWRIYIHVTKKFSRMRDVTSNKFSVLV